MTESLTFSNSLVENPDIIFYNFVGNFIPPEWFDLRTSCGKILSKTARQLLSLIVIQNKLDRLMDFLADGTLTREEFFRKKAQLKERQYELTELIKSYDKVDDKLSKKLADLINPNSGLRNLEKPLNISILLTLRMVFKSHRENSLESLRGATLVATKQSNK